MNDQQKQILKYALIVFLLASVFVPYAGGLGRDAGYGLLFSELHKKISIERLVIQYLIIVVTAATLIYLNKDKK